MTNGSDNHASYLYCLRLVNYNNPKQFESSSCQAFSLHNLQLQLFQLAHLGGRLMCHSLSAMLVAVTEHLLMPDLINYPTREIEKMIFKDWQQHEIRQSQKN